MEAEYADELNFTLMPEPIESCSHNSLPLTSNSQLLRHYRSQLLL